MKKVLRSGKVYMGTCGEPTELTDSYGNDLFIGDLVDVFAEKPKKKGILREATGPEYVVVDDDGKPFVMGLKNALLRITEYYLNGEKSDKDKFDYSESYYTYDGLHKSDPGYKWLIVKIKDHKDTVDGECWGSGNITVHLEAEENKKLDEVRKEVF